MQIPPFLSSNPLHLSTPCQRHACQCVNEKSHVYLYIFVCHLLNNITWHTIFQARDKSDSMILSKCSDNEEKTSCYCKRKLLYCQTLWLTCGQGLQKLSEKWTGIRSLECQNILNTSQKHANGEMTCLSSQPGSLVGPLSTTVQVSAQ